MRIFVFLMGLFWAFPLFANDFKGIVFFPGAESRPSDDSFSVKAGETVPYCISIDKISDPFFKKIKERVIGFQFILEDQNNPPRKIRVSSGHRFKMEQKDEQGCYLGQFKIPTNQVPGLYQVADLMVVLSDQSFYSLREALYNFKHVDEIVVENKHGDSEAPYLVKLGHFGPEIQNFKTATRETIVIKPSYFIQIADEAKGIHKKSVRAFVSLSLDGHEHDVRELKCKKSGKFGYFGCKGKYKSVLENWYNRSLKVELVRIELTDKMRNRVVIEDKELMKSKLDDSSLQIEFVKGKQIGKHRPRRISQYLPKHRYNPEYKEPIIETESLPSDESSSLIAPESR